MQAERKETLSVLKLVHKLLATKRCPFWIPSVCQVALKLQASIPKLKAEVKALPGAVMHVTLLTLPDLVAAPVLVSEIAGAECTLNPAVLLLAWNGTMALALSARTLVNDAVPQTGMGEQLCIVQMFAPVRVPIGTAEHVLDEAPASIYGVFMGLPIYNRRVFLTNSLVDGGRALGDKWRENQFYPWFGQFCPWSE
jgi:hypothetical protein